MRTYLYVCMYNKNICSILGHSHCVDYNLLPSKPYKWFGCRQDMSTSKAPQGSSAVELPIKAFTICTRDQ